MPKIENYVSERELRLRKIALDILAKCESEKLSIYDYKRMAAILDELVMSHSVVSSGKSEQ